MEVAPNAFGVIDHGHAILSVIDRENVLAPRHVAAVGALHDDDVEAARGFASQHREIAVCGREPPCRFDAILMDRLDASAVSWQRDILSSDR